MSWRAPSLSLSRARARPQNQGKPCGGESEPIDRSNIRRAMLLAWRGFDYYARRVFAAPTFPRLFFQTSYIFMRACCVSIRPSVRPSVSPSVPQHGAVVCASEPVLCPSYARGRASSSSFCFFFVVFFVFFFFASSSSYCCSFWPKCVRTYSSRIHERTRPDGRTPAHLPRPYAVFSSVVGEKQPIEGRVPMYSRTHTSIVHLCGPYIRWNACPRIFINHSLTVNPSLPLVCQQWKSTRPRRVASFRDSPMEFQEVADTSFAKDYVQGVGGR